MKPVQQPAITLQDITDALDKNTLAEARAHLASTVGAKMEIAGTVVKVIKRDGLKLFIQAEAKNLPRPMQVFAEFTDEDERQKVENAKIRKNSIVNITGSFQTFGESAVNLNKCFLNG